MENKLLVTKAMQGDQDALVQLIMAQDEQYYQLSYVYMKNRHDSLDAIQDMIVVVYENIHRLKNEQSFYTWSKVILVNCCKKLLRKKKKTILLDNLAEEYCVERAFGQRETQLVLEKHLAKLSNKQREVINLRYALDLEYQMIAEILKVPLGTVKSRINSAQKQLKLSLGGENIV
jgi:RNA polymerase sigma factor (sigma-70 family)